MRWLILFVLLSGCKVPVHALTAEANSAQQEAGHVFTLRQNGETVIAVRRNFVRRPDIREIAIAAENAIEAKTGCTVTAITGDVAQLVATTDCAIPLTPQTRARWVGRRAGSVFCTPLSKQKRCSAFQ